VYTETFLGSFISAQETNTLYVAFIFLFSADKIDGRLKDELVGEKGWSEMRVDRKKYNDKSFPKPPAD
jgi:hypothetical protein